LFIFPRCPERRRTAAPAYAERRRKEKEYPATFSCVSSGRIVEKEERSPSGHLPIFGKEGGKCLLSGKESLVLIEEREKTEALSHLPVGEGEARRPPPREIKAERSHIYIDCCRTETKGTRKKKNEAPRRVRLPGPRHET